MVQKDVFTIVIFPGSTGSPKKIQLPKKWASIGFYFLLVFAITLVGAGVYSANEYVKFLDDQKELAALRHEGKIQKIQIERFGEKIRNFETEMSRLERFEKKLRIITALENSAHSGDKNWGVGGPYGLSSDSFTTSLKKESQSLLDRFEGNLGVLTNHAKVRQISFQELDEFLKNQKSLLSSTPSIWPTRGWVTSGFGYRISPFTGLSEKHEGLDIAARMGAEVRAPADGKIILAGRKHGYGNMVEIDHGYGVLTRYGHNAKNLVEVGEMVKRGQVVALVGSTGRSTGPHVHYEVVLNGIPVSPMNYILEE